MKFVPGLLLSLVFFGGYAQERPSVRFGMALDGPSPLFEKNYMNVLVQEVTTLLERDYQVVFDPEKRLDGAFDLTKIKGNLDVLLADEAVDVVLCMGVLSTQEAAGRGAFEKPVFAPFGIDPTLPIYPRVADASGVKNFNYMVTPGSITRDAALIARLKPMKRVHLVVMDLFAEQIPNIRRFVEEAFAHHQLEVTFVLSNDNAEQILAQLGDDVELVYITPLIRFTEGEKAALFQGLAEKRLPSFSLLGRQEVELGALAGLAPRSDTLRWFRRLALNIQRSLMGEDPGTLPVLIKENSQLVFNMETARKIGWFPSWDLQISATLLNEERQNIEREFSMEKAVHHALKNNTELAARERELAAKRVERKLVRSHRKPTVESSLTAIAVDEDSADASFGSQGKTEVEGTLTVSQLLYSEGVNAAVTIQDLLVEAEEKAFEVARLDLALQTSERYLNYLKSRTLYTVRRENLDLTNKHLETARIRRDVGFAGPAEVYRWESQLASDKLAAIGARNTSDQALYALNQILNEPQEFLVRTEVPDMMSPTMRSGFGRLQAYVGNAHDFARFRFFMVAEALRDAPELAQLDALIAAQKRKLLSGKRAYYLPTVALKGNLNHQFHKEAGTNALAALLPPGGATDLPMVPDTGWNVALNFSLPLFQGGARKHTVRMDGFGLERLEMQRRSTEEQLELRIRSGLQDLATASVGIQLRRDAANAAAKNLELLEDAYAKGVTTLIDLLDAQNAALVGQLAASNAIYDYFIALMRFQRASGNFDFFITPAESDAFYERLEEFYEKYQ